MSVLPFAASMRTSRICRNLTTEALEPLPEHPAAWPVGLVSRCAAWPRGGCTAHAGYSPGLVDHLGPMAEQAMRR